MFRAKPSVVRRDSTLGVDARGKHAGGVRAWGGKKIMIIRWSGDSLFGLLLPEIKAKNYRGIGQRLDINLDLYAGVIRITL